MERIFQTAWEHRMWGRHKMTLTDGRKLEILDPGRLNTNAGPDFSQARILIDNVEWAGNIELHIKASDWERHGHSSNQAYDSVILHVVTNADKIICRADGTPIPHLEITVTPDIIQRWKYFATAAPAPKCRDFIKGLSTLHITDWMESLAVERMQTKAMRILDDVENSGGDWQHATFVALAGALGFGLNSIPLRRLASMLSLNTAARHSDDIFQLEAILFGMAGMLGFRQGETISDSYFLMMQKEFIFLQKKYELKTMPLHLWKYSRTRPSNFPHRRIALLAAYLLGGFSLFSVIIDKKIPITQKIEVFNRQLSDYWQTHSSFGLSGNRNSTILSKNSISLLLINFVAPLLYAYGNVRGDRDLEESCFDILTSLPPEDNTIIRHWRTVGLTAANAMRTQALIHLHKTYCDRNECMRCRFGKRMLQSTISI